jgi:selenocysteine-specific elongation factor
MTAGLPEQVDGRTRLWVDRVFSVRGTGTVITGTLSSGTIRTGDELQVHPSGECVRVRGIESLKKQVERATGVARVALNLRGAKLSQIRRGDALTAPGEWADVSVMDVRLSDTGRLPAELVLHLGSAAVSVHVRPLGEDTARLTLARPLPTSIGERGVLRDPGAQRVVAASTVLDVFPPPLRRRGAGRQRAQQLASMTGAPDLGDEIRRRGAASRRDVMLAGVPVDPGAVPPDSVAAGDWLIDASRWRTWRENLVAVVDAWASGHPLQPGMPRRSAAAALELPDPGILEALVHELSDFVIDSTGVHRHGLGAVLPSEVEQALTHVLERLAVHPFDAPELPELAAVGLEDKYLAAATRQGRLVRIAAGVYLRPDAIDMAVRRLTELAQPFAVTDARQALVTSRRVAVPLLEWLDRAGLTHRVDARLRRVRS